MTVVDPAKPFAGPRKLGLHCLHREVRVHCSQVHNKGEKGSKPPSRCWVCWRRLWMELVIPLPRLNALWTPCPGQPERLEQMDNGSRRLDDDALAVWHGPFGGRPLDKRQRSLHPRTMSGFRHEISAHQRSGQAPGDTRDGRLVSTADVWRRRSAHHCEAHKGAGPALWHSTWHHSTTPPLSFVQPILDSILRTRLAVSTASRTSV